MSTKVHVAVDALGNPARPILNGGQVADLTQGTASVSGIKAEHVIVNKDYDRSELIEAIEGRGANEVIPP